MYHENQQKQTKVIATIPYQRCEPEFIQALFDEGMNVVRLNTAHLSEDETLTIIKNVRTVSPTIALLLDTKGPEIRTTEVIGQMPIETGKIYYFYGDADASCHHYRVNVNCSHFVGDVPVGSSILVDDGELRFIVEDKNEEYLSCRALNDGMMKRRKSVNVPNVSFDLPTLSKQDKEYLKFAGKHNLDFVAHSFVRNKADIEEVQTLLNKANSSARIIAKIENMDGVVNIDEILDASYGIMVARGDLAVEISHEKIPAVQKEIIEKCRKAHKPVIVATQLLHTMIENPTPTRAEVTDIANAVFQGADSLMLSGETASGIYPIESVAAMSGIIREAEKSGVLYDIQREEKTADDLVSYLCKSAIDIANHSNAEAILISSCNDDIPHHMASYRGKAPLLLGCTCGKKMRKYALSYGIFALPNIKETKEDGQTKIGNAVGSLKEYKQLSDKDTIVILSEDSSDSSTIQITTVDNF